MTEFEFVARKKPLEELYSRYKNLKVGELVVIYGRRRLGKSELAKNFLSRVTGAKLASVIPDSSREDILQHLQRDIERDLHETKPMKNWEDLFYYFECVAKRGKFVVVLDEVQRLHDIDKSFFSDLQKWWDNSLRKLPIYIIVIGSAIGLMQKIFHSASAPLFSRKTWSYLIEPFTYAEFRNMFPELSEEEKVKFYVVFGGTPAYLSHVKNVDGDIKIRIRISCLKKGSPLYEEPPELLRTELKRSDRYNAILHAIAKGKVGQKEIADAAGFRQPYEVAPYLEIARKGMHIIRRDDPVGGKQKHGRYTFKDNYFHFWYKFLHPAQSILELGNIELVENTIMEQLPVYMGRKVEGIIHELLIAFNGKSIEGLKINFKQIGSWWTRTGEEIDIAAIGDDFVLLGEIEWSNKQMGSKALLDLIQKSKDFPGYLPQKYLLVSKSGFSKKCKEEMQARQCVGLTLEHIERYFDDVSRQV